MRVYVRERERELVSIARLNKSSVRGEITQSYLGMHTRRAILFGPRSHTRQRSSLPTYLQPQLADRLSPKRLSVFHFVRIQTSS
jgi:hypothetical protein